MSQKQSNYYRVSNKYANLNNHRIKCWMMNEHAIYIKKTSSVLTINRQTGKNNRAAFVMCVGLCIFRRDLLLQYYFRSSLTVFTMGIDWYVLKLIIWNPKFPAKRNLDRQLIYYLKFRLYSTINASFHLKENPLGFHRPLYQWWWNGDEIEFLFK